MLRLYTIARHLVAALAAVVLVAGLASCAGIPTGETEAEVAAVEQVDAQQCEALFATAPTAGAPSLTIVVDPTASALVRDFPDELKELIYETSLQNGTASILAIDGEKAAANWVLDSVALNDGTIGDGVKRHARIAQLAPACVEIAARSATPTEPGSDLATAMRLAGDAASEGTVWIESDGMSSVGALDFDVTTIGSVPPASVAPALATTGELPNWDGRDVIFSGLGGARGPVISQDARTWIEEAYLGICAEAGAATCSIAEGIVTGTENTAELPEDAPVALPPVATVVLRGEACVYTLEGILFGGDSSELSPTAIDQIMQIVGAMSDPRSTARVVGHTAGDGDPGDPLALERANAVAGVMILSGVGADRVEAIGVGSSQPIGSAEQNRRVEVEVQGLDACA